MYHYSTGINGLDTSHQKLGVPHSVAGAGK